MISTFKDKIFPTEICFFMSSLNYSDKIKVGNS